MEEGTRVTVDDSRVGCVTANEKEINVICFICLTCNIDATCNVHVSKQPILLYFWMRGQAGYKKYLQCNID